MKFPKSEVVKFVVKAALKRRSANSQVELVAMVNDELKKVDKDSYETMMRGLKFKVGHRRPYWKKWSYQYPEQDTYSQRIISILEETLAEMKRETVQV